ncbi:putative transcription factor C2H2 family [Helianthus annuus]|uniref:Putative zinc finger, C2H2-like protein n=1 Tax=Helianthus annuus TaxID=4232 RepID=A0A251VSM5_HELAN|nr:zinc finger protein ZAT6 [Helianthus annuus]KAF5760304.1 putative transcription factor C2H2 family [Helianthus annuus]KAJ0438371.1 putative transcription factor C2H2 family [Helianthus annuus]KAJ0460696.1 putative transcription factor C2H2 family [Helianthus annuus]KAJ0821478.1 putative transcription factor C2H2 family [Helianthus annuus]
MTLQALTTLLTTPELTFLHYTDTNTTTTTTTVTACHPPPPPSPEPTGEDQYLALTLMLLARGDSTTQPSPSSPQHSDHIPTMLYACNICNKVFPTYQALGGHKSSHRRNVPLGSDDQTLTSGDLKRDGVKGCHECSICHRCFPSGQALGGHKRRHYDGGGGTAIHGQPRDFDLNLPACPEYPFSLSVDG